MGSPWRLHEGFATSSRALHEDVAGAEGFAKASAIPTEASWSRLEGFAKAPRAPSFGNDSSDSDKPPDFNCFGYRDELHAHPCSLLFIPYANLTLGVDFSFVVRHTESQSRSCVLPLHTVDSTSSLQEALQHSRHPCWRCTHCFVNMYHLAPGASISNVGQL